MGKNGGWDIMSEIRVVIDGRTANFPDPSQRPELADGRIRLPLRAMFNALGVSDNDITFTQRQGNVLAFATVNYRHYTLVITENGRAFRRTDNTTGETTHPVFDAGTNGDPIPPVISNGRFLVPLRRIFESVGCTVNWEPRRNNPPSAATVRVATGGATTNAPMTLSKFNSLGWAQIHSGYVRPDGTDSPHTDLTSVISRKLRPMNQSDVTTINALFNRYEINTKTRISAFFAQCEEECNSGERMVEGAGDLGGGAVNRTNLHKWFVDNHAYGYKYRGAGAIQLTWKDWNYIPFQSWMNTEFGISDNNILDIGTEHVAFNYPWHAAVFYWNRDNLNRLADTGDIREITRKVKGPRSTEKDFTDRTRNYDRWMRDFTL